MLLRGTLGGRGAIPTPDQAPRNHRGITKTIAQAIHGQLRFAAAMVPGVEGQLLGCLIGKHELLRPHTHQPKLRALQAQAAE